MSTAGTLPLTSAEIAYLESCIPLATEAELAEIERLLTGERPSIATPRQFRQRLQIEAGGQLKPLEDCLDDWQRADYEEADKGWLRMVTGEGDGKLNYYFERPKGHDKTTGLATMSLWALHASPRALTGVAGAGKLEQAKLLRDEIDKKVRTNPWLAETIKVNNYEISNRMTGSVLNIITRASDTNQGWNPDFVICDEISVWPERSLWDTLFSASAKKANCLMAVIANAGRGQGVSWQWEVREKCRESPRWYFSRLDGPVASWLSPEKLAEQADTLLAAEYKRVWLNQWTPETGEVLDASDIEAAITLEGPSPGARADCQCYVAGLDLGLTRDHAALVILGVDVPRARIKLCQCISWNPQDYGGKIPLPKVQAEVFEAWRRFGLNVVCFDPWQAVQMGQQLEALGVPMQPIEFSKAANLNAMATHLVKVLKDRQLDLYRDKELVQDLYRVKIMDRIGGFKIEAMRDERGHCDRAMALALALPAAVQWQIELATGGT